ncbi:MAG: SCO family protein, partial [Anaerolineae bacterium]|nr:SCO family protein [Anaerolineae bacterium]
DSLGKYLDNFKSGFIGLVPTSSDLEQLKTDYGLYAEKEDIQDNGSYLMAHTGLVYVIDKAGNLRLGFFSDATADDMTHDIKMLLNR